MAYSVITIWNLALSAVGSRGAISSESEVGREADLCRLWFPLVRDTGLKAASWPCATKFARLALLAERADNTDWTATDPNPTWRYAYGVPSDLLAPRHLVSYARFVRGLVGSDNALMTNESQAVLCYTMNQTDISRWDAGLVNAVVHMLAAKLAKPISGKVTLAQAMIEEAREAILLARAELANESDDQYEMLPSWIAARGYEMGPSVSRFVWPAEDINRIGA